MCIEVIVCNISVVFKTQCRHVVNYAADVAATTTSTTTTAAAAVTTTTTLGCGFGLDISVCGWS